MWDRIIIRSAWLNAELQSNWATAALHFVLIAAWVSLESDPSARLRTASVRIPLRGSLLRHGRVRRGRLCEKSLRSPKVEAFLWGVTVCSMRSRWVPSPRLPRMKWLKKFVSSFPKSVWPSTTHKCSGAQPATSFALPQPIILRWCSTSRSVRVLPGSFAR